MKKIKFLLAGLLLLTMTHCANNKDKASEIDAKLTALYDSNHCVEGDTLNFIHQLEKNLREKAVYEYSLDSLSKRINIMQYDDVKLYDFDIDVSQLVGENFYFTYDESYSYLQYLNADKKVDFIKLEDKGDIINIYKFNYNKDIYYLIVSFYYDEDTNEDEGGVLRVLEMKENKLTFTDRLFPDHDLFNFVYSLRMDNFAFDPATRTVSYDQYGISENGDMEVIGRESWQLER